MRPASQTTRRARGIDGFVIPSQRAYIGSMPRKPLDLPMKVAKAFIKDMRAFHAEPNAITRDEIAGRQMHALRRFQRRDEKPVRIPDIKEMFEQMKDQAWPTHGISGFWLHSLGIQASIESRVHHHRQRLSLTPIGAPPRPAGVFIGGATRFVLDCSGGQAELPQLCQHARHGGQFRHQPVTQ
jgi:hypothetical protein